MSDEIKCLNAFQSVIRKFKFNTELTYAFPENFAIKRFQKKCQEPDATVIKNLKQKCWDDWLQFDQALPAFKYPSGYPELYKARLIQPRSNVKPIVSFPKGEENEPTRGRNSIESRLSRSSWACSEDNFDVFHSTVMSHKALKRAFRKRYHKWYTKRGFDLTESQSSKHMFSTLQNSGLSVKETCDRISKWKLRQVMSMSNGGRFSSVPKNNSVRRPIIIEDLCNMIVQKQIGQHFRDELSRVYGVDLDSLQEKHRKMISCDKWATIDLKNASDSIHCSLVEFFLPPSLFKKLMNCRSSYVYGPDGSYHPIEKISSMGNGYTFELMTWILTSVVRQLDPEGSVYGDDIIISKVHAVRMIQLLERMGFTVNEDKTFINGDFRESCGGNFHDLFGYVESYDFIWPEDIHDCIVFYNKAKRLSPHYAEFQRLCASLHRHIPKVLRGPIENNFYTSEVTRDWVGDQPSPVFSSYFRYGKIRKDPTYCKVENAIAADLCYKPENIRVFNGFAYNEKLGSPSRIDMLSHHWAKYEMYLHAGRVCKDIIFGKGTWVRRAYVFLDGYAVKLSRPTQ